MSFPLRAWKNILGFSGFTTVDRSPRIRARINQRSKDRGRIAWIEPLELRQMLSVTSSFNSGTGALTVTGDSADDTITLSAGSGNVKVNGGDVMGGVSAASVTSISVDGGAGSDTIGLSGVTATDFTALTSITVNGGDGNDFISGSPMGGTYSGGNDNDTLYPEPNSAADTFNGNAGNDIFYDYGGSHTLVGGAGDDAYIFNDFLVGDGSMGHQTIVENSSEGSDTLSFQYLSEGITVDMSQTSEQEVVPGVLWLTIHDNSSGTAEIETVVGTNYNDTITGNSLDNTIWGESGDDRLVGGAGNDQLIGDDGNDTLEGDAGNDILIGGYWTDTAGNGDDTYLFDPATGSSGNLGSDEIVEDANAGSDTIDLSAFTADLTIDLGSTSILSTTDLTLTGSNDTSVENVISGSGNDTISGNSRDNILDGRAGDDQIYGLDGNDTISGDTGTDTLTGGAGNDVYVFDPFFGNLGYKTVVEDANVDSDTLDFSNFSTDIFVDLTNDISWQSQSSGVMYLYLSGNTTGIENVIGGSGNDEIFGNSRDNVFDGGSGNDTLVGRDGNDRLYGGFGQDDLEGDNGSDALYGGADNDTLYGGSGDDFLYGQDGDDLLTDYQQYGSTVEGGNDYLDGGAGDDQLYSYSGSDTLIGGVGDDLLYGGTGDDTYSYSWVPGNLGLGADTIYDDTASGSYVVDLSAFRADDYSAPNPATSGAQTVSTDALTLTFNSTSSLETVNGPVSEIAMIPSLVVDTSNPDSITLTAWNPVEYGGTGIDQVKFYYDTNTNGAFDSGVDQYLGNDTDGSDGWSITVDRSTIPAGPLSFFAQAVGTDSGAGAGEGNGGSGGGSPGGMAPLSRPIPVLMPDGHLHVTGNTSGDAYVPTGSEPAMEDPSSFSGDYQRQVVDFFTGFDSLYAVRTQGVSSAGYIGTTSAAATKFTQPGFGTNAVAMGSTVTDAAMYESTDHYAYANASVSLTGNTDYTLTVGSTISDGQELPYGTPVNIDVYAVVLLAEGKSGDVASYGAVGTASTSTSGSVTVGSSSTNVTSSGVTYTTPTGSGEFPAGTKGVTLHFILSTTVGSTIHVAGSISASNSSGQSTQFGNLLISPDTPVPTSSAAGGLCYIQLTVLPS